MKLSAFQGVLLGVFILCGVIGLFVFATYSSNGSANKNAIGTVVIWGTLPEAQMQAMLTAAIQANSDLKNVSYVQKDPSTLPTDLATAIATGAAPNLVLDSQENLQSLAPLLTPIPLSAISESTFKQSFIEEGNLFQAPNGAGYYGIPFLVDPLVLFSNNTILSSDDIAEPPSTWEALTGLVPTVSISTPSEQLTRSLIALGTYTNVHDARGILSTIFLQSGVPISGYSTGGVLSADLGQTSSNGQPPGEAVLDFYTQFADPSKVSYTWNASLPDSQQAFLAGNLALYLGYASEAPYFESANPNLDFTVSPIPQPATATAKTTYGLLYAFMIPRGAKNTSGAYQVAALFTNTSEQSSAASATGLAPASRAALTTVPSAPSASVAYAEALYAKGWLSPSPTNTDAVFSSMINNVISGQSTVDTALSSAENSLTSLLQQ